MSLLMQKLLRQLHAPEGDNGEGSGGGGDHGAAMQREQELEASRQGWVPKDKFKGNLETWKPASEFLAHGRSQRHNLESQVSSLKAELEEFKGTAKQFAEFQRRQIESRDSEIADLQKSLKAQLRTAIRDGDDSAADAIEGRIELLDEERRNSREQLEGTKQGGGDGKNGTASGKVDPSQGIDENGHTTNPTLVQWIASGNEWMRDNRPMREYAFAIANELIQNGETRKGTAFLGVIREKMEEAFPRYFGEGRSDPTKRGSVGASGGGGGGNSGSFSRSDLPKADLELLETGLRQGWIKDEKKFLADYFSEGPRIHRTTSAKH